MNIRRLYQITLLILITLLLYNSAGCFFVFKLMHTSIQHQMDFRIKHVHDSEELISITFKTEDLSSIGWLKKGKEFLFKGKRYDIVSVSKTKDAHIFRCIADEEEDYLFADFDRYSTHDDVSATKHKPVEKSITLFYPLYFMHKQSQVFYLSFISLISAPSGLDHYAMVYREVHHPPPSIA